MPLPWLRSSYGYRTPRACEASVQISPLSPYGLTTLTHISCLRRANISAGRHVFAQARPPPTASLTVAASVGLLDGRARGFESDFAGFSVFANYPTSACRRPIKMSPLFQL